MSDSTGKYDLNDELRSDEEQYCPVTGRRSGEKSAAVANSAEIYLVQNEQGETSKIVLPVYGSGLWSVMYAFIAIDVDGITSEDHFTTSTVKRRGWRQVDNPQWRKQWIGKSCLMKKVCRLSK